MARRIGITVHEAKLTEEELRDCGQDGAGYANQRLIAVRRSVHVLSGHKSKRLSLVKAKHAMDGPYHVRRFLFEEVK